MKFRELVRLWERDGFRLLKAEEFHSLLTQGWHPRLVRADFHGAKEVPAGTCHAVLKAAGVKRN